MKTKLVPVLFPGTRKESFDAQLAGMREMFREEADFAEPARLGDSVGDADAAVFLQLPGEAYRRVREIRGIGKPILLLSSPDGARSMWDWEQTTYLKAEGIDLYAPHDAALSRMLIRAASLKRRAAQSKFLIWQDVPASGFYWYNEECQKRLAERIGLRVEYASYRQLCEKARAIGDEAARQESKRHIVLKDGVIGSRLLSAYKLYMAMREQIGGMSGIVGVGCNCLDESRYTDTSPCLAWNLLNRELGLSVVCEADTLSLATEWVAENTVGVGTFSTNIYPFLMGAAAVKHEKISAFPQVERPEDCALLVHCGYCGMIPERIAKEWVLRPSVLGMLDENAVMVDARIPQGDVSLLKLHSDCDRWLLSRASMEGYVQYPGSDCRNGGLIRVKDGYDFMGRVYSHHITVMPGNYVSHLKEIGKLLGFVNETC